MAFKIWKREKLPWKETTHGHKGNGSKNGNVASATVSPDSIPGQQLLQGTEQPQEPESSNKSITDTNTTNIASQTESSNSQQGQQPFDENNPIDIVIAGAGIVGLVLALALHKYKIDNHTCIHIYEQADAFHDDVGAGMGMYPNGLRVIRDISIELLHKIQQAGCPYQHRRWMRHDGTEVAVADETVLTRFNNATSEIDEEEGEKASILSDDDLQPIGIRRWRLQKFLYEAAIEAGIIVHFGKRLDIIKELTDDTIHLRFADGTTAVARLLLAADGAKSRVRTIVTGGKCKLRYMGTTCLMGTSNTPRKERGLALPSSPTTKCHGAFYPTGPDEQCFQFHFPVLAEDAQDSTLGGWGGMTHHMSQEECQELATQLEEQGWDPQRFLQPLRNVERALKIGLTTLEPPLEEFTFGRIVLIGDAAHPPVPYLGQGAQQGMEDAGTLALLLEKFCVHDHDTTASFSFERIDDALYLYNKLRVPRTTDIVERGKLVGQQQQKRADSTKYNKVREQLIQRDIFFNENSIQLFPGVKHDYKIALEEALEGYQESSEQAQHQEKHLLRTVFEEE